MSVRASILAAVCAAAPILGAAAPVRAQTARSVMSMIIVDERSTFAPDLSRGDLAVFARVLGLSDEERRALDDLYGAYASTLATEGREVRSFCAEIVERAELVQDQRILTPARKRIDEWNKRTEQLKVAFLEDLRVLLTSEQEARWPILERELRRLKRISDGRLPGEAVDLIRLVGDTPGTGEPEGPLAEVLDRYAADLDRAIVARDRFLDEHREGFGPLCKDDPQRALDLFKRSRTLRTAIRDVNVRYARLIGAELPADAAADFADRVFKATWPRLAEETRGERYIRAAATLGALTSEQSAGVQAVIAEYDAARRRLLDRTARTLWDYEIERLPSALAEGLGLAPAEGATRGFQATGLGDDHPITALRLERYELDRATRGKIDALLSPEQRRALPDTAVGQVYFTEYSIWGL